MKLHKRLLSLALVLSTLVCCFTNFSVTASDIDVSGYTYVVDNMTFYKGDKQVSSLDEATEVAVDVTRRVAGGDSDRLIISTYSDMGEYIGMYSVTHHIDFGKTSTVKVLLNVPEGKTVGEIRAYMWKSFSDMRPLSNVLSSNNNMIIDPRLEYEKELQTTFTDVSVNDSFADAVSLISYLGIMNGYEDGTFRPTSNLRVADAARFITYMTKSEFLASLFENEELVSDEIPSSIERGYINYCVDSKYLIPDANGYVNYDSNITVKDFLILTINALGYHNLAKASGGWPRGYVNIATQLEFENLTEYNYSADITRAEAAQILAHAVNVPIAVAEGYSYTSTGELVERYVKQDGIQSLYYHSILTDYYGMYTVEGYVVRTQKDNVGLKADEVDFAIAKTQKYAQEDICILNAAGKVNNVNTLAQADVAGRRLTKVNVGDTAAAEYKGIYATALLRVDENENWSFIRFTPSDKNVTITLDISDLDTSEYEDVYGNLSQTNWTAIQNSQAPYLKFFVDGATTSTKYMLDAAANIKVYVNGVHVVAGDPIWTYVINGDIGDVKLVDTYRTDGKIDTIYVNKYVSGMFAGITSSGVISFTNPDAGLTQIVLDDEDETLEYHIYYNGEEITVDELQKDDVLTIAYDVTAAVKDSKFYDIYVSRDVVTDILKGKDADEKAAKFGDTYYTFASTAKYNSQIAPATVKLGDKYTLYLDAFGRVFKAEQNTSVANWAIAEKFTKASSDDYYKLTVFTADGETKAYYFNSKKASVAIDGVQKTEIGSALDTVVGNRVYSSGFGTTNTTKNTLDNRVVTYKVSSSSGMITELNFMDGSINTLAGVNGKEVYSARRNAIGTIKLGEITKVIDATNYILEKELSATTYGSLVDEAGYKAYAYGTKIDGIFPFILVTETTSSPLNYAFVEGFTKGEMLETCHINLYDPKTDRYGQLYFTEDSKITTPQNGTFYADEYYIYDDFWDKVTSIIYDDNSNLSDITQRIVSYRTNYDTGYIEELTFLPVSGSTVTNTGITAKYDYASKTIGNISLTDKTLIVDASKSPYMPYDLGSFVDGTECEAYAYDLTSDGNSPFVIVTSITSIPAVATNWGIAEKFTKASSDDYYKLTVFTADGETKAYYFNSKRANVTVDGVQKTEIGSALDTVVGNRVYSSGFGTTNTTKNTLDNRVVTYKVSASSGMITELNFMDDGANNTLAGNNGRETFSARRNAIGNMKVGKATKIIDATKYASDEELSVATYESLVDEVGYTAYAYGNMIDNAYPFVLITSMTVSPINYAIVEGFTKGNDLETCYINLYNPKTDCYEQLYFTENSKITTPQNGTFYGYEYYIYYDFWDKVTSIIYNNDSNLSDITQRIVSYKMNYDTGCIEELTFLPASKSTVTNTETTAIYNYASKTIGNISLTDNALIVDTSKTFYMPYDLSSFVDGTECEAYAYDLTSDENSPFVIVTSITSIPAVATNWGIIEKFTKASSDDYYKLTLFTADGETKAYYLNSKSANVTINGVALTETGAALEAKIRDYVYAIGAYDANLNAITGKSQIENRIITYKVSSSSGMITELNFMDDATNNTLAGVNGKESYSARRNAIGTIKLCDATKIINATNYVSENELSATTYESLVDEVYYKAYAYGTTIDGIFPFVLITEGEAAYNKRTRFAVVTEDGYKEEFDDEAGDVVYSISAMYGDAESLIVSDDISMVALNGLKKGDVIFFKTNAKGQVTAINKLFSFVAGSVPTQANLAAWSLVNTNTNYANLAAKIAIENVFGANFSADFTTNWDSADRDAIKIVYGPVIDIDEYEIYFGKIDSYGKTDTESDVSIFEYSDDIRVYTYDYSQGDKYRFEYQANAISAIPATTLIETNMEADGYTVDWNKTVYDEPVNQESVTFAFAVVVNDEVQDIFAFIPR